jgi:hypothetical protein
VRRSRAVESPSEDLEWYSLTIQAKNPVATLVGTVESTESDLARTTRNDVFEKKSRIFGEDDAALILARSLVNWGLRRGRIILDPLRQLVLVSGWCCWASSIAASDATNHNYE